MTVAGTIRPLYRPYRGYDDPGLPDGIWWARGALQGDGSSGSAILTVEFKAQAAEVQALNRLFSLEESMITMVGTDRNVQVEFENWDAVNFDPLTGQLVGADVKGTIVLVGSSSGGGISQDFGKESGVGGRKFMGAPLKNIGSTDILFQVPNTDGDQLHVFLQGYWWETRAINAPGGPRRPVDGLLGR